VNYERDIGEQQPRNAQVMKLLGMEGMAVIKFELHCAFDKVPTVDATFYPNDAPPLPENEVTQTFELTLKD